VPQVTAVWAAQIAALLAARGRATEAVLASVGLAPAALAGPEARIDFARHAALIEAAAAALDDPCFGLHFGAGLDPLDAGAIAYLAANSPDLQAALENYRTYLATVTEGFRASLQRDGRLVRLVVTAQDPAAPPGGQCYEFALAATMNICRFVVGRRLTPRRVEMRHPRSDHRASFEKYFGVPVRFAAADYALTLEAAQLALPCRSADPRLFRIVKAYCDEALARSRRAESFRAQVENLVASLLPTGTATTAHVAATLGVSERSLSRRLAEEGTSFRDIVQQQRRQMAHRYLDDPAIRPTQVAYLLGYAQPSAFSHAFRRWTGVSPAAYRAQNTNRGGSGGTSG
jgi:AraC-like DNA-binding protein